jgi:hypothetical protein
MARGLFSGPGRGRRHGFTFIWGFSDENVSFRDGTNCVSLMDLASCAEYFTYVHGITGRPLGPHTYSASIIKGTLSFCYSNGM